MVKNIEEKHFTVDDLVKKLSLNKQNIEYYIREDRLKIYLLETEVVDYLDKEKKEAEKSKLKRKETEERYQERQSKIPKEKKYYDGKVIEL